MMLSKQFQRFLIVGISNTLLCYLIFEGIYRWIGTISFRAALAQTVAYVLAAMWSYQLNRRWTFGAQTQKGKTSARFFGVQAGMFCMNTALLSVCVDYLKWQHQLSWVLVTGAVTVLNFAFLKFWVFRVKPAR